MVLCSVLAYYRLTWVSPECQGRRKILPDGKNWNNIPDCTVFGWENDPWHEFTLIQRQWLNIDKIISIRMVHPLYSILK